MGVRPPPSDDDETAPVEFGIAAVDARVDGADLSFPATASEVARALSNPDVRYDAAGNTVALADALDRTDRDEFDSKMDLLDALHPVFEEARASTGSGLLQWVRALLPG